MSRIGIRGEKTPPPNPWMTLPEIKTSYVSATATRADPHEKNSTPRQKTTRVPNTSPSTPAKQDADGDGDAVGVEDPGEFTDRKAERLLDSGKEQWNQSEFHHESHTYGDRSVCRSAG